MALRIILLLTTALGSSLVLGGLLCFEFGKRHPTGLFHWSVGPFSGSWNGPTHCQYGAIIACVGIFLTVGGALGYRLAGERYAARPVPAYPAAPARPMD